MKVEISVSNLGGLILVDALRFGVDIGNSNALHIASLKEENIWRITEHNERWQALYV